MLKMLIALIRSALCFYVDFTRKVRFANF